MRSAFISIDSATTRDIDDAFAIELQPDGGHEVAIAIANVAAQVVPGSGIDLHARQQGCTIYRGDKAVASMLPRSLAEEQLPLRTGKARRAMLIHISLNAGLDIADTRIAFGEVHISSNLAYASIPGLLKETGPVADALRAAEGLARGRLTKRRARGALALFDLTRFVASDEEGNAIQYRDVAETIGHVIVQELMILGNEAVATWAAERGVPMLFRVHQPKAAAPSSGELARELESWIAAGEPAAELARKRLAVVADKARYDPRLFGHYALNLPLYLHATSPIRRYADLLNQHQIAAVLDGRPPPYDVDALAELAPDLNDVLARHKEDRSGEFKLKLAARAEDAVDRGYVQRLADHELVAALKLAATAGEMPESVAAECARRIADDSAGDRLYGALLGVARTVLPANVRHALADHVVARPPRAVSLLMHAQQRGAIESLTCESEGAERTFSATLSIRTADGQAACSGSGERKRDAEQAAYVRAFCWLVGVALPAQNETARKAPDMGTSPPKSRLLELCQKYRWPMPAFRTQQTGTAHAPSFSCTVVLQHPDGVLERTGANCASKKDAELMAAELMLAAVKSATGGRRPANGEPKAPAPDTGSNPISAVMEWATKHSLPAPVFEFRMEGLEPPTFCCDVTAETPDGRVQASARAGNKKDAKRFAAAQLAEALRGNTVGPGGAK